MPTRENIRLIARSSLFSDNNRKNMLINNRAGKNTQPEYETLVLMESVQPPQITPMLTFVEDLVV